MYIRSLCGSSPPCAIRSITNNVKYVSQTQQIYADSPSEYTGRQTNFQNLASPTQIEPLKMTYIT